MIAPCVARRAHHSGIMDPMDETRAAFAVVGSMREPAARALRRALFEDSDAGLASRVSDAMSAPRALPRVLSFWAASGHSSILAVRELAGIGEAAASLYVGAALHALVLSDADVNEATVIALAERAAAWDRGRMFGEATKGVHA